MDPMDPNAEGEYIIFTDEELEHAANLFNQTMRQLMGLEPFDGTINIMSGILENEMAQTLGEALLDSVIPITRLGLPIFALTEDGAPFTALLDFLKTCDTIEKLVFCGLSCESSHDSLNSILEAVKDNPSVSSIRLIAMKLKVQDLVALSSITFVDLTKCSLHNDKDQDQALITQHQALTAQRPEGRPTFRQLSVKVCHDWDMSILFAVGQITSLDNLMVDFQGEDHTEDQLAGVVKFVGTQRLLQQICLFNLDVDGSYVVDAVRRLSAVAHLSLTDLNLLWSPDNDPVANFDQALIRSHCSSPEFVEAVSQTMLVSVQCAFLHGPEITLMLNPPNLLYAILHRNRQIPLLMTQSNDYWNDRVDWFPQFLSVVPSSNRILFFLQKYCNEQLPESIPIGLGADGNTEEVQNEANQGDT